MSLPESSREESVYKARLAEQASRFEDMFHFMAKAVKTMEVKDLAEDDRKLLSVAYKNVIGARIASWRVISSIEKNEQRNDGNITVIKEYKGIIEDELTKYCDEILKILDSLLIPSSASAESEIYYHLIKADCYGHLAKFKTGTERKQAADRAFSAYELAKDIVFSGRVSTEPLLNEIVSKFNAFVLELSSIP